MSPVTPGGQILLAGEGTPRSLAFFTRTVPERDGHREG